MARSRPAWWDAALRVLLDGGSIADAGRAAGKRRETVSRALADPQSPFAQELARLRAAAAPVQSEQALVEKAVAVVEQHLGSGDTRASLDAAKVALTHAARTQAAAPPEPAPEEEVSAEMAVQEVILMLPVMKVLMREHPEAFPPAAAEELKAACRKLLADLDALAAPQPPPAPPAPPAAPPRSLLN